jgi:hypothetical protein
MRSKELAESGFRTIKCIFPGFTEPKTENNIEDFE